MAAPFLSSDFLVLRSRLSPSRRRLTTMLPASFASKPNSSPASGMEGLRRKIAAIGSTPPPPVVGSSLWHASVLSQGMGEGLSLTLSGQASGKWYVSLSRLLRIANTRGLLGGFGGTSLPWHAYIYLEVTIRKIERDIGWY